MSNDYKKLRLNNALKIIKNTIKTIIHIDSWIMNKIVEKPCEVARELRRYALVKILHYLHIPLGKNIQNTYKILGNAND